MFTGTLVKIKSTHENLRSNFIDGAFHMLPLPGESFHFYARPIKADADLRMIATSPVTSIQNVQDGIEFTTGNSTYRLVNVIEL